MGQKVEKIEEKVVKNFHFSRFFMHEEKMSSLFSKIILQKKQFFDEK